MFRSQVHESRSRSLPTLTISHRLEWLLLLTILLLAAALRLWQLNYAPPGLTHDEAGHGQDALAILNGARPVYETIGYGREPLYDYLVAVAMGLLGRTDHMVLRWVSAFFGLLTVVGTYLWSRRAFGPWEAILASGWLAGSFWGIATSRQALRSTLLPALLIAAIYTWWRAVFDDGDRRYGSLRWFVATGLILGATLWAYMAARVTWVLFLAMPLHILVTDWHRFKKHWPGMVLSLILAGAVAAPMFVWLQRNPGAEQRFSQLGEPLRLIGQGDFRAAWANSIEALKMFTVEADDLWVYNVSGRPWLGFPEGLLFYAGLLVSLWRWRQPRYALALMLLFGGLVPSLITGGSACSTRAIAILPVLYVFPAIAVTALVKRAGMRRLILPLTVALVVTAGAQNYHDYFNVWATHREVRVAYHTTLHEISRELEGLPAAFDSPIIISSIYPGEYHDPYTMELLLRRKDLSLRWVDGRGGIVFPGGVTRLIVPALAELDPALAQIVESHGYRAASRKLAPDDLNPRF
ncbi:MAG: glycosyltransferase family 39 protein, partial [Anaerolineae bacterium]|nr:glycosyltransferase family 39 protein [Anaerolineae bacterium]